MVNGNGEDKDVALVFDACEACEGRGYVLDAPSDVLNGRTYYTPCEDCGGTGHQLPPVVKES